MIPCIDPSDYGITTEDVNPASNLPTEDPDLTAKVNDVINQISELISYSHSCRTV